MPFDLQYFAVGQLTILTGNMASLEAETEDVPASSLSHLYLSKEPFVGNVSKVSPHAGASSKEKSKKGDLVFDACFEGGEFVAMKPVLPRPLLVIPSFIYTYTYRQPGQSGPH